MPLFSKRKYNELDDVSTMTESEREKAILALEARRYEINRELEGLMTRYAKLTKNRRVAKRKFRMGDSPNDYRPKR